MIEQRKTIDDDIKSRIVILASDLPVANKPRTVAFAPNFPAVENICDMYARRSSHSGTIETVMNVRKIIEDVESFFVRHSNEIEAGMSEDSHASHLKAQIMSKMLSRNNLRIGEFSSEHVRDYYSLVERYRTEIEEKYAMEDEVLDLIKWND